MCDNKLSNTILLSKLNLPENSDEDEKALRSLTVDFENIRQKNQKINENNTYRQLLDNVPPADNLLVGEEENGIQSYDDVMADIGANKRIVKDSVKELVHLDSLEEECPTCHQKVNPGVIQNLKNQSQARSQRAESEVVHDEVVVARIKRLNSIIETKEKKQREFEDLFTRVDYELPSSILDGEELKGKIDELKSSINRTKAQLREIIDENTQREQHNTRIQVILEQTGEFEKELKGVKESLLEQEKVSTNLEVLKRAFSTNGLVAYKLENLVKELEDLANEYLAELSDGRFNINFVVANDKLNVDLSDNGNSVDILALSSGELARVNTATLIAIRKLMSSISKSRINVLFLDEVINVLDEMGREKLIEVLLAEEGLNTYIVSHGWTHPLLEKIEVIKENNISRLE